MHQLPNDADANYEKYTYLEFQYLDIIMHLEDIINCLVTEALANASIHSLCTLQELHETEAY